MLFTEKMLTLDEAAKVMPLPSGCSKSSLYRWWRYGYNGVKLECRRVGRALFTSREAVERFAAALAEVRAEDNADPSQDLAEVAAQKRGSIPMRVPSAQRKVPRPAFDAQRVLERAGLFYATAT